MSGARSKPQAAADPLPAPSSSSPSNGNNDPASQQQQDPSSPNNGNINPGSASIPAAPIAPHHQQQQQQQQQQQPVPPTSNTLAFTPDPATPTTAPAPAQPQPPLMQGTTTTTKSSTRAHHKSSASMTPGAIEPSETPYYLPDNPDNEPDVNGGVMLTVSLVVIFLVLAGMGLVVFCLFRRRSAKRRTHFFSKGSSSTGTSSSGLGDLFVKESIIGSAKAGGAGALGGDGAKVAVEAFRRDSLQSLGYGGGGGGSITGEGQRISDVDVSRALQEMTEQQQNTLLLTRRSSTLSVGQGHHHNYAPYPNRPLASGMMSPPMGGTTRPHSSSGYWNAGSGTVTPIPGGGGGGGNFSSGTASHGAGNSSALLLSDESTTNSPALRAQGLGISRTDSIIIGGGDFVTRPLESSGEFRNRQYDDYYGGLSGGPGHSQYLHPGLGRGSVNYNSGHQGTPNLSRRSSLSPGLYPQHNQPPQGGGGQSSPLFRAKTVSVGNGIGQQQQYSNQHQHQQPLHHPHSHPYGQHSFYGPPSAGRQIHPIEDPANNKPEDSSTSSPVVRTVEDASDIKNFGSKATETSPRSETSPLPPLPKSKFNDGDDEVVDEGILSSSQNRPKSMSALMGQKSPANGEVGGTVSVDLTRAGTISGPVPEHLLNGGIRPQSMMAFNNNGSSRPSSSATLVIPPSITTRRRSNTPNKQIIYSNVGHSPQPSPFLYQHQQKQQQQQSYFPTSYVQQAQKQQPYSDQSAYYQPPQQQQPQYYADPAFANPPNTAYYAGFTPASSNRGEKQELNDDSSSTALTSTSTMVSATTTGAETEKAGSLEPSTALSRTISTTSISNAGRKSATSPTVMIAPPPASIASKSS